MISTTAHNPFDVRARHVDETYWVSATDQEPGFSTERGGEIAIFLSRDQARKLRDEFNAMDLGEENNSGDE